MRSVPPYNFGGEGPWLVIAFTVSPSRSRSCRSTPLGDPQRLGRLGRYMRPYGGLDSGPTFFNFISGQLVRGGRDKLQPCLRGPLLTRLKALRQAKEGDQDRQVRLTSGDAGVS